MTKKNEVSKSKSSVDPSAPTPKGKFPVLSGKQRIQTAEGWKRSMIKKRQQGKKTTSES